MSAPLGPLLDLIFWNRVCSCFAKWFLFSLQFCGVKHFTSAGVGSAEVMREGELLQIRQKGAGFVLCCCNRQARPC